MTEPSASELEKRAFRLGQVFNPTSPIDRQDLFAGRRSQIRDIVDAINQRGQHAVLYGERGVGKTSLANMIIPSLRAQDPHILAPQVNCMSADKFSDIWKRAFEEILFTNDKHRNDTGFETDAIEGQGEIEMNATTEKLLRDYTGPWVDEITPDVVRRVLYGLGQANLVIIILDEYDTVEYTDTRSMMSNTLKFISDRAVPATVVLVGVADDVETLVADHRSLERNLRQVPMPRMSNDELEMIVRQGLKTVGMTISSEATHQISQLSRGLPHYAHLLGLHAGRKALDQKGLKVENRHVGLAIGEAISKTQASTRAAYSMAITSSRKEAMYRQVLLACALADADDLGWFYPKDVRKPLEKILGRTYKIEAFARHLHAFSASERGPVLIKDGRSIRPRYRFENPLMQPHVIIRGLAEQLISSSDLTPMKRANPGDLAQA
jgi:Cdc6-like AAA superfamily ATPase